jgi:aspartyl-tRNA(Asn)/glutamyl-tRNA(Gln) amidotransferase subunit A
VACCAITDAVLAGTVPDVPAALPVAGLRIAVPQTVMLDGIDETVSRAFSRALSVLSQAGARVTDLPLAALGAYAAINATGGFSAAESFAWHRALIERRGRDYDPRVLVRMERGRTMAAADYVALVADRARFIATIDRETAEFDVLACPTVPIVAPPIAAFADDKDFARLNMLLLRNPAIINFLDRCAITLPIARAGELPSGLMLVGRNGEDRRLLALAAGIEAALAART